MNAQHRDIFLSYLKNLLKLIEKIEQHAGGKEDILQARPAKDMFPLGVQARVAISFSLRACCKQLDQDIPALDKDAASFAGLMRQASQAIAYIEKLEMPDKLQEKHRTNILQNPDVWH